MGRSSPFVKLIYPRLGRIIYNSGTSCSLGKSKHPTAKSQQLQQLLSSPDNMKFSKLSLLSLAAISTPALACVQFSLNFNLGK